MQVIDKEVLTFLLEVLKDIKEGKGHNDYGICNNVCSKIWLKYKNDPVNTFLRISGIVEDYTGDLFKKWPYYSGNAAYPVPSCNSKKDPEEQYSSTRNYFSKRTTYGRLRLNLLDFMIKYVENSLKQLEETP